MKPAKLTLIKTLATFFQNIKFCKAQSWVNFRNILYFSHIFLGGFPPFWPSTLIFGEYLKIRKSQPIRNNLCMNQLAIFILFTECHYGDDKAKSLHIPLLLSFCVFSHKKRSPLKKATHIQRNRKGRDATLGVLAFQL